MIPHQEAVDYHLQQRQAVEALRLLGLDRPDAAQAAERVKYVLARCSLQVMPARLEAYLLETHGRPSREQLAGLLEVSDPEVVVEALQELARAGPPVAAEPIVARLDDPRPGIALAAARAALKCLPASKLAELAESRLHSPVGMQLAEGVAALFPQLLEGLLSEQTAAQAARSLTELCLGDLGPRLELLRDFLRTHQARLPVAAFAGLGFVQADWVKEFAPQLHKVLADSASESHLRSRALLALQSLGQVDGEVLRGCLNDTTSEIRYYSLEALGDPAAMAAALEREEGNEFPSAMMAWALDPKRCRPSPTAPLPWPSNG